VLSEKNKRFQRIIGEGRSTGSAYRVRVCVKEVRSRCAMGYEPSDCFTAEKYYKRHR